MAVRNTEPARHYLNHVAWCHYGFQSVSDPSPAAPHPTQTKKTNAHCLQACVLLAARRVLNTLLFRALRASSDSSLALCAECLFASPSEASGPKSFFNFVRQRRVSHTTLRWWVRHPRAYEQQVSPADACAWPRPCKHKGTTQSRAMTQT